MHLADTSTLHEIEFSSVRKTQANSRQTLQICKQRTKQQTTKTNKIAKQENKKTRNEIIINWNN